MRGRKRFVQVDMHGVDAEIARTRLAYDSVEICSIAVKIGARLVNRIRDPNNLSLEQPASVWIRQHDRGDIRRERAPHCFDANDSILARRYGPNGIADEGRSGRIRAMSGIWNQHHPPRLSLAASLDRRLDRHHAAELAMRARLGDIAIASSPVIVSDAFESASDDLPMPLAPSRPLQGMHVGESRQPRHLFVETRIVLHRARAQRDRVRRRWSNCCATAHIVPDRLGLGEARRFDRALAPVRPQFRLSNGAAAGDATPVASKRPLSKMSASSMFKPRLPVKVSPAEGAAVSGRVGRP